MRDGTKETQPARWRNRDGQTDRATGKKIEGQTDNKEAIIYRDHEGNHRCERHEKAFRCGLEEEEEEWR